MTDTKIMRVSEDTDQLVSTIQYVLEEETNREVTKAEVLDMLLGLAEVRLADEIVNQLGTAELGGDPDA